MIQAVVVTVVILFLTMMIIELKRKLAFEKDRADRLLMENIQLGGDVAQLKLHTGRIYRNVCSQTIQQLMRDFPGATIKIADDGHVTVENWHRGAVKNV